MKCRCCDCAHLSSLSKYVDYCDLTGLRVESLGERECACFKRGNHESYRCVNCNYYKEKCCSMIGQKVLDPNAPHCCGAFVNKKAEKVHVPCYVTVRRFYKCWIEVDANAERSEIESKMKQAILDDPENELIEEDPDIELEEQDIEVAQIDWDGIQPCDEDESEDEQE